MAAAMISLSATADESRHAIQSRADSQKAIHPQLLKAKATLSRSTGSGALTETPAGKLTDNMTLSEFALYPRGFEIYQRMTSGKVSAIVEGDDGCLYVKNPISVYTTDSWLKLEHREGTTYVARLPQPATEAWEYEGETVWLNYDRLDLDEDDGYYFPSFTESELSFKYENGVLTSIDELAENEEIPVMLGLTYNIYGPNEADEAWAWFGANNITVKPMDKTPVSLPEGIVGEKKIMNTAEGENLAWVAVSGDNVYLRPGATYGYAVGKLADGKVTFESNQYLGVSENSHCYFYGGTSEFVEDEEYLNGGYTVYRPADNIIFSYNTDGAILKSDAAIIINEGDLTFYGKEVFDKPVIQDYESVEAAPKNPVNLDYSGYDDFDEYGVFKFELPTEAADGTAISKVDLYYNIYVDGSETPYVFSPDMYELIGSQMTDVPYNFSDGDYDFTVKNEQHIIVLYEDFARVGVQSINVSGDKEYRSAIVWNDGKISGIEPVVADPSGKYEFFDLTGRPVNNPTAAGIYIRRQGNHTQKVMIR